MKNNFLKFFILVISLFFLTNQIKAKSLKLLWWNVQNFFDTTDDPLLEDTVLTKEQYDAKIKALYAKLKSINPDIIGLAEVENINVLKDIALRSGYPYYYLIEGNDPRGIDVCLISKLQAKYISHKNQPTPHKEDKNYRFSRDCPEAVITIDQHDIHILLNHLKSKKGDEQDSLKKQTAQVKGILDIIHSIYKENKVEPYVIIMGDMNCYRHSEPLNILEKSELIIINYMYKESKTYTSEFRNIKKDIDFFILNNALYSKVRIKRFKTFHGKDSKIISDHYPVYLEIDF